MKKQLLLLSSSLLILGNSSFAQDFNFSQPYAAPLQLNPALVGSEPLSLRLLHTFSSHKSEDKLIASAFSADFRIPKTGIGAGIYYQSESSYSFFTLKTIALPISYTVAVNKRFALKSGFEVAFSERRFDSPFYFDNKAFIDLSAGMLLLSPKSYTGVAIDHFNKPSISSDSRRSFIPSTIMVHTGTRLFTSSASAKYQQRLLSGIIYRTQGPFRSMTPQLYYNLQSLVAALQYNYAFTSGDYAEVSVGLQRKNFRLIYSHKTSTTDLNSDNYHTFSLAILPFGKKSSTKQLSPFPLF